MIETLVFDTGPLSHFAKQNWLGVLKAIVGERVALIPDTVLVELELGANRDSRLQAVLDAHWIERRELTSDAELRAYATFAGLLVARSRNRGEAGVLALASTIPNAVAIVDDAAARKAADANHIAKRPTLVLLCEGIRAGLLTVPLVAALADDLLVSKYHLPFRAGGFEAWARENDLV